MNQGQANLSVMSCGSVDPNWEKKPKKPIVSKIIRRDAGDFALILTQDVSKPLRFLYLLLLTDKNRLDHIKALVIKVKRLLQEKANIIFEDMSIEMKQISSGLEGLVKNLKFLQAKMEKDKDDQLKIVKLCEQNATVDPLLILTFRAIAHSQQCRIKGALSCNSAMSLVNVYDILRKFGINKEQKNELNRFVLFLEMKEIDLQFFRSEGISIETQLENCEELFDAYLLKYEEQIVLEQLYCELSLT